MEDGEKAIQVVLKLTKENEELKVLTYEQWVDEFIDEMNIKFAETGADRELGFNSEDELEKEYELYLQKKQKGN